MSKSSDTKGSSSGIGVFSLLGVAFVILKLCHVIDWSWWWVTAPFWGGFVIIIGLAIIAGILAVLTD
jgi:phosphoglycerol transferase MdoB-like AlkP superfamily enzyme